MAVNVRTFNAAASDFIRMSASVSAPYGTFLAVIKRNSTAYNGIFGGKHLVQTTDGVVLVLMNNTTQTDLAFNDADSIATIGVANADGWVIIAGTKASGTVAARLHKCVLSGPTWTHGNGGTAPANGSTIDEDWHLGYQSFYGNYFNGSMYLAAYWAGVVLSDGQLETFNSVSSLLALNPTSLWLLNQANVGTAITDYQGTGQNQSAISGTTVTQDTIPNFDSILPPVVTSRVLVGVGT